MNGPPSAAGDGGEELSGSVGANGRVARRAGADERIARVVFAALVVACFAAFLITQRLKHTPTAVQEPKLTPVFAPAAGGELGEEHIAFKLAEAGEVTVTIETTGGEEVATLVRDLPAPRYKTLSLRWNGREGAAHGYTVLRRADGYTTLVPANRGRPAPVGEYDVRVSLRKQARSVLFPSSFKLVRP